MTYRTIALLFTCAFVITNDLKSLEGADKDQSLSLIVMDPLSAPLSCPCVEGYAQRRYEVLATHLEATLNVTVRLTFAESVEAAVKKSGRPAQLVIGKDSVVRADCKDQKIAIAPLARLTDQEGRTSQFGLIVVGRDDPAKKSSCQQRCAKKWPRPLLDTGSKRCMLPRLGRSLGRSM